MLAPIILFVYNRPWHSRQTVEALQKNMLASESELYVFADGPKKEASNEQITRIKQVRDYIGSISGFKDVHIFQSPQNKGLANSVIEGVTNVINKHGKAIVVEDDIVTHPFFLRFMNDALEHYFFQENIFLVSGFSYNIKIPQKYNKDIYSTHRCCSWGWATWSNRWEKVDWNVTRYNSFRNSHKEIKKFNRGGNDLTPILDLQMNNKIDSWAIRWAFCMYEHDALCINPIHSLVYNIGFDGSGTHKDNMSAKNLIAEFPQNNDFNCVFPVLLTEESILDKQLRFFLDGSPTIMQRIKYSIKKRLRKIT